MADVCPSVICLALLLAAGVSSADHPVLPVSLRAADLAGYRRAVEPVMEMSEADMRAVIPTQSGLYFCDCPNCTAGMQEGQFADRSGAKFQPWDVSRPGVMRCTYCGHEYPSEKYPMAKSLQVHNPRGELQEYPYWEDEHGYRYFFAARIDYHRLRYMESAARNLGRAYHLSGEAAYARRCALVLERFAEVFPGYCYHFDYPFQQKVIYDGNVDPKDFRAGFRTARWSWWAYMDIPAAPMEAYDLIYPSGELGKLSAERGRDVEQDIEAFFTDAVHEVQANRDDLTNMSPGMWAEMIRAGRVLGQPAWVHEAVGRLERFVATGFFNDGAWSEGAPSYNSQVIGGLGVVFDAAAGYSDPPGYTDAATGRRFDNLDLAGQSPAVVRAKRAFELMRFPNGRLVPIHDTWSTNGIAPLAQSTPFLLPAMGLGCLAGGEQDNQWQAFLTWGPGLGHLHYDGLSLLLWSQGREALSDLGYTHTRDRVWTLPTAAHNTVVVDQTNQTADRTTFGNLCYCDASDPACQLLSVDNPQVYPGLAQVYRRTLIAAAPGQAGGGYLVDLFEVQGGRQHDYFLHGCADEPGAVTAATDDAPLSLEPLPTLLPPGFAFAEALNEGECGKCVDGPYAYGYLRDLQRVSGDLPPTTTLRLSSPDGSVRLCAALLTQPGDELVLGRNPAVRGAGDNDDQLRDYWRPFALWRRTGGQSLFAAIIGPLTGQGPAPVVQRLNLPGAELAAEVTQGNRHDLLLVRPRDVSATWQGQPVVASAELAVIRGLDKPGLTVVAGSLRWGTHSVRTQAATEHRLLAVDRQAGALAAEGEFLPPAGAVVLLDHARQRVSAYTVTQSRRTAANSQLMVSEDPGFDWDAAGQTATFRTVPGTTFTGPHVLRMTPIAHLSE